MFSLPLPACSPIGQTTSYFILGDKGRAQLLRGDSNKLSACIQDANKSKDGLSFASASLIAESILKESSDKTQIVFNRFQSARPLCALPGLRRCSSVPTL